ncbi:MAG: VWA domain-containing protein [Cytophagales bacterium]|nr:VWA domain-containing protein [Cytophagales bacterium]MDW8384625.1 VWA domain-containing protein [Flammeovirgaceae bacterium]
MPEQTRILFVLDASGSMRAEWEGRQRIEIAKKILTDLVDSLRANKNLQLGLRVYGHQYDYKQNNCTDSKLEVGFGKETHNQIIVKLNQLVPQGTTPMAYSMEKATEDFPAADGYRNILIMITDGKEECKGDPCAISKNLQKRGIFLRPFVVGLGIPPQYEKDFACMGKFYNAQTVSQFKGFLGEIMNQALGKTTVSVELLDINELPKEKDINISFVNRVTGETVYDYVHYRDNTGKTDTLKVDAILTYDIIANTIPRTIAENISFEGGKHNVVKLKVPQGTLQFDFPGYTQYNTELSAIIRESGKSKTLVYQKIKLPQRYLVGKYDIEIPTLPISYVSVEIKADQITRVSIPAPGVLNINNPRLLGFGSIYHITPENEHLWIMNFEGKEAKQNITLQPGTYKVVFRAEDAYGSEYTIVKKVKIESGTSVTLNLIN